MTEAGSAPGTVTPVDEQVALANASGRVPVVFVHGLWLVASSWDRWAELFADAGYAPVSPGWPDDPATKAETTAGFRSAGCLPRSSPADHGWAEVARAALDFVKRFT